MTLLATLDLSQISSQLAAASPAEILAWAVAEFGDTLLVTTALGAGGVLLLDDLHRIAPAHPTFLIDTGQLFAETLAYRDRLIAERGYRLITIAPDLTEAQFSAAHGERLWERDPNRCCRLRKVLPNDALLKGKRAWIAALRRDQGGARTALPAVELDPASGALKIYPLVHWNRDRIAAELASRGIPEHPLWSQGFPSLGCVPCTSRVTDPGLGERAGRWAGTQKTECGLHDRAQSLSHSTPFPPEWSERHS